MTKYDQATFQHIFHNINISKHKLFRHLVASVFVLFEQFELLCNGCKLFQKSKTILKIKVILILSFSYVV